MNFKRIFRVLVCLVLVCVMLIGSFPIKASAIIYPQVGMYPEEIVVRAVVQALGIYAGENPSAFDDLCNAIRDLWDSLSLSVYGFVKLVNFANGGPYARADLIEVARKYLYDSGVIGSAPNQLEVDRYTFTSDEPIYTLTSQYYQAGSGDKYYHYIHVYSAGSLQVAPTGLSASIFEVDGIEYMCRTVYVGGGFLYDESLPKGTSSSVVESYIAANGLAESDIAEGFIAAFIGARELALSLAYPSWEAAKIYDEELGKEIDYYPLGLGQTVEETMGMTQEQIWAGEILGELEELQQQQVTQSFLQQLLHQPLQTLGNILETLIELPGRILSGLTEILTNALQLLFVPRQEFLQEKIQLLTQRFAFVTSLVATGKAISTGLSGISTNPPVIYIDLGANRGPHNLGGRVPFLDLRWYAEYKPTVDTIISAFLWICFIWRMLLKLPGIISGMPGDWVMGSAHSFGLDNHLPSRNSAYEVQRQSNREQIRRGPGK